MKVRSDSRLTNDIQAPHKSPEAILAPLKKNRTSGDTDETKRNPPWTEEELILALDLYFRINPMTAREDHPDIVALSDLLNGLPIHPERTVKYRNPNGVFMKLRNFLHLDPTFRASGLAGVSKLDRQVWDKYSQDRHALQRDARLIRARYGTGELAPTYTVEDFARETGFVHETIRLWERRLRRKKHLVFQGPPGSGKTFVAERLARLLTSETTGFWRIIQFHPGYTYEDFMQGIKPRVEGQVLTYSLESGAFRVFCSDASSRQGDPCVLVIDEINRANLSSVFGELMYLLEHRDTKASLAYGGEPFSIPSNVYIIGTMNTADRSIALVDHALRRRFSFVRLNPEYSVLRHHLGDTSLVRTLTDFLKRANAAIGDPDYHIGTSFFLQSRLIEDDLQDIWEGEIEPYLEEFFYEDPAKVKPFRWAALEKELGRGNGSVHA